MATTTTMLLLPYNYNLDVLAQQDLITFFAGEQATTFSTFPFLALNSNQIHFSKHDYLLISGFVS